jgi:hypothetical protein
MVAEGEVLETNLLHASQRIPASSGVLDEVFGTHKAERAFDGCRRTAFSASSRLFDLNGATKMVITEHSSTTLVC